ncbi:MAG: PBP1A family penicillin-binding protein [Acidobacteriota bacterium]|nr:PBP1A family penicillin-binding protein [Acidobacteriota bacterium]
MATRTPVQPASQTSKTRSMRRPNQRRAVKFIQPDEPRWKRTKRKIRNFLTHPGFYAPVIIFAVGTILTLGYFWMEYSERVDRLLNGEVFTRSAGIYAAPKLLRDGESINANELTAYLKGANYVDKSQSASESRGRFRLANNALEIEPGEDSSIDGKQTFAPVRVRFSKDGKTVAQIENVTSGEKLKSVQLEPRLLSSVLSQERERRKVVAFNDLPPHLVKAITTTEDRAFFEHWGVNLRGILRALWRRVDTENDNSPIANQGGSSITQQLVKNLLLSPEKSLTRKAQEAYMSVILETRLPKEKIFELYANQIYLGQQAGFSINGVGEAANAYFGKDVTALNLAESAFLAGIIRSPNRYNPYKNPDRVKERRNQVLDSMAEAGAISRTEADVAKALPLTLTPPQKREELTDTPYFTEFAQAQLANVVADPEAVQHLRVYTTLDLELQKAAQNAVTKRLDRLDKAFKNKAGLNAALVAIRPKTGEVVAMIGGRDYLQNQFNRATDAMRQPGSVFKPFVYASAINTAYDPTPRVITAATVFKDEPKVFTYGTETYKPNNYGDFFSNKPTTVRDALVKSKNTITVDLAMELNVGKVMNLAAKAGLPKVPKAFPSMALGTAEATPLQMASAFTAFANLGQRTAPSTIARVTTGDGTTVAAPQPQKTDVLRSDVSYIMVDMMKDVVNRGTAAELRAWGFRNAANKIGIAGKTGTSRDGWFVGFTPELVCAVYVGFDNGDDLGMKGSDSAMPIWADFMRAALDTHPEWNGDWAMPAGIEQAEIDITSGRVVAAGENSVSTEPSPTPDSIQTENQENAETAQNGIPVENRRLELFITGTVPNRASLSDSDDIVPVDEPEIFPTPLESPTPFEHAPPEMVYPPPTNLPQSTPLGRQSNPRQYNEQPQQQMQRSNTVLLQICTKTGFIAASSCLTTRARTFKMGEEPAQFCRSEYH